METSIKEKADQLFEDGELETLYELIEPFLKANDPYAQLLYSSFSLERLTESDEEFEARSLALLKAASEGGLADASYRIAVLYSFGDMPAGESDLSSLYFERAIAQGHSHSKFTYGFNLYYGTEVKQDKPRGLQLLKEAADDGIELAKEELKIIYSTTRF
ncbi:MAG: sel1 repeat family protein [Gammaproteobacteria bacterium]|nr:MAG: sel1 repeat family protein [Gammaproteobacteria bacterium]